MKSFYLKNVKFEFESYDSKYKKYVYISEKCIYLIIQDKYLEFSLAKIRKFVFFKSLYNSKILSLPNPIYLSNVNSNKHIYLLNLNTVKKEKRYFEFFNNKEEAEEKIKTLNLFQ